MPVISAFADHPTRPYVRVEVNWADVPAVTHARVLRVNTVTGECAPLRPYICFEGDHILLSCGHALFWDTEAPLDTPVYYITEGLGAPCIPSAPELLDTFTRTEIDTWGSATPTGQTYTNIGGTVDDYDVNGAQGTHTLDATNSFRQSLVGFGHSDFDATVEITLPVVPTGAAITHWFCGRVINTSNYYAVVLNVAVGGATTLLLHSRVAGVLSGVLGTASVGTHAAGDRWEIHFQGIGSLLRATARNVTAGAPVPADWQISVIDGDLTTGTSIALLSRRETGNTNGTVVVAWDNLSVTQACTPCEVVTATSSEVTVASNGSFWLKDPVRPCNDRPVPLCATGAPIAPGCGPSGITFIDIGAELYTSNSIRLRPTNRKRPIAVTRTRADATTVLRLQALTFDDRDDLITLAAPGSPLLFQGPQEYGVPDRYMDVATVQIERAISDHRVQVRTAALPYETVDRQAGPTQGICGTRVQDVCEQYPTWQALVDAGFSWEDLLRGRAASAQDATMADFRTWNDVNTEFASWDAVNTGGRTWDDLLAGG